MAVVISLLRGINVGGNHQIKMDALRELYASLKLKDIQTYVQSGNVVFRASDKDLAKLPRRIEDALEKKYGFRPDVIHRTASEMKDTVARNPFAGRGDIEPGKLLVLFLADRLSKEARAKVLELKIGPEEMHVSDQEVYIYFPEGMGRSKFPFTAFGKALQTSSTGRNWNSVTKLLEMAEKLEA